MNKKEIVSVLEEKFGKSRFELNWTSNTEFTLILNYPEIRITNSKNDSHTIKDLYVMLEKRQDLRYIVLYGCRGSVTKEEYGSGYSHSHLYPGWADDWSDFCLGSSELSIILRDGNIFKDKLTFEYFLEVLDNYLAWESIEGVPYIRIDTISGYKKLEGSSYVDDKTLSKIPLNLTKLDININFRITDTEELEEKVLQYAIKEEKDSWIVNKIGNNYFSKYFYEVPSEPVYLFNFKKKEIFRKIIENEKEQKERAKATIHPEVKQKLCERITREIQNYYIKSNRISAIREKVPA